MPFCSIGPRLGLDLPALFDRIVEHRRGGYCFEHNGRFFAMLAELGFDVQLLLARVIYNRNVHPGLTHRITLVKVGAERYIADVGFGPMGPRAAVGLSGEPTPDGMLSHEALLTAADPVPDARRGGADLAGVFYTGGTTGFPKGVMLSHDGLCQNSLFAVTERGISDRRRPVTGRPRGHLNRYTPSRTHQPLGRTRRRSGTRRAAGH